MFHNFFISVRRCTCFRRVFRPSAQNCTYSVRYWSDKYLKLYAQFWAPDDGRKNHLKHVQRLTEIKKLWNIASYWLYSAKILAMHGPMNVKYTWNIFTHILITARKSFSKSIIEIVSASLITMLVLTWPQHYSNRKTYRGNKLTSTHTDAYGSEINCFYRTLT